MSDDTKPPPPPGALVAAATPAAASAGQPTTTTTTATTEQTPPTSPDVVVLGPPTADGAGVHVLRARPQGLETGELRSLQEGRPITGEIVTLAPRKDNPRICDVKDSYSPAKSLATGSSSSGSAKKANKGPAQVATQAYRDNWEEVFARRTPGDVLN